MFSESVDDEQIIERVAALDIGKAELVCCVRLPGDPGSRRVQEVSTHSTMTRSLTGLANRLVDLRVERVVMEATSDYWKPVFYLLEPHGLDHHALLLRQMLNRIDGIDADIDLLDTRIEEYLAPFADAVDRLDEIPGIGATAAAVIIAEIGVDMSRFPTAGHLCSWARFAPGIKSSAGKTKGRGSTGHGTRYLARTLGEAAVTAGRSKTFLGERYRRLARRRGKKRAQVAVGRSILIIVWHLLADPGARYLDLGPDHYTRSVSTETKKRNHIRQLQALGYTVTIEPAA